MRVGRGLIVLTAVAGFAASLSAGSGASPRDTTWTQRDLGTLGGFSSVAEDVNDRGWVVGWSGVGHSEEIQHAFLWRPGGRMIDLGTLPGDDSSAALFINNAGQVVGQSGDRAFLWQNGRMTVIAARHSRAIDPAGINANGEVVGTVETKNSSRAFVWTGGRMTILGTFGGAESDGDAINDAGQIVGEAATPDGELHAFVWQNGVMTRLLELRSSARSEALAIGENGEIVGDEWSSGRNRACRWADGGVSDLGPLPGNPPPKASYAWAVGGDGSIIVNPDVHQSVFTSYLWTAGTFEPLNGDASTGVNEYGQIAGETKPAGATARHAAVWQSGTWTQLTKTPSDVQAINNGGTVVGDVRLAARGRAHATVWLPQP